MTTIVYENEFIFNETEFFNSIVDEDNKSILDGLELEKENFKFVYQKDSQGLWYRFCYKGDERINRCEVPNWMRTHVWDFENENRIFFR